MRVGRAPGRVNLIGEHTDYNDGFVLPVAIDRYTTVAARERTDRRVTVEATDLGETDSFDLDAITRTATWADYVRGVVEQLEPTHGIGSLDLERRPTWGRPVVLRRARGGSRSRPLRPAGAGTRGACAASGKRLRRRAMRNHGSVHIRKRTGGPRIAPRLPRPELPAHPDTSRGRDRRLRQPDGTSAGDVRLQRPPGSLRRQRRGRSAFAPSATRISRNQGASARHCSRRARHVVSENERTVAAARALESGDLEAVGRLMDESHRSMRDDYEIVPALVDAIAAAARAVDGCFGARLTGAGFGGCAVALVETRSRRRGSSSGRRRLGQSPTLAPPQTAQASPADDQSGRRERVARVAA